MSDRDFVSSETCSALRGVQRRDCETNRKECTHDLRSAFKEDLKVAISGSESRIKVWVLTGMLTLLGAVIGTSTCSLIRTGAYQEKVDSMERRIERIEERVNEWVRPYRGGHNEP